MQKPPRLMTLLNLAHFSDHYCLLIFPTAVLGLAEAWRMSYAEALALGSSGYIAFALATLPAGWLGDRWGRVETLRLFFPGLTLGLLVTGTATSALQLSFGLIVIGLAAALYHPVATALVVQMTAGSGKALAVNGLWGNMGVAAAALASGVATAELGWRWAFLLPAAAMATAAVAFELGSRTPLAKADQKGRTDVDPSPGAASLAGLSPRRMLVLIGISALFGGLVFNGVTFALPKLVQERLDAHLTSLTGLGLVTALTFAIAAFAQLPVGTLLDRYGARLPLLAATGLQALCLAALWHTQGPFSLFLAAFVVLLVFGEIPITAWLLAQVVAPAWQARAYALQHLLSLGVAALTLPMIAGLHGSTGTSTALFGVLALASLTVCSSAFLLLSRYGDHRTQRAGAA
ncbi:MAG: MFS transporter [Rhodospirillales bacterium]